MATDYDAPRKRPGEDDVEPESVEELRAVSASRAAQKPDLGDDSEAVEAVESFELPGADLSNEVLTVEVNPQQADEFVCTSCFLVRHRSQIVNPAAANPICHDCD